MPFQPLAAVFAFGTIAGVSAQETHKGETVSGDGVFVETGRQNDPCWHFLLVDVMGHGVQAAQVVIDLQNRLLVSPASQNLRPADLLKELHDALQIQYAVTGRHVAALALLVHPLTGTLVASKAALPEPWIGQPGASWNVWPLPAGRPLGFPFPATYSEVMNSLASGQQLLAFSDGVTEAGKAQGCLFENGPLQSFLGGLAAGLSAGGVIARLMQTLQSYSGIDWPEDDTSVFCLQCR